MLKVSVNQGGGKIAKYQNGKHGSSGMLRMWVPSLKLTARMFFEKTPQQL